jgi:hypothetical protein
MASLSEQWEFAKNAPVLLLGITIAVGLGMWALFSFVYRERLAARDDSITLVTRQRDDYKDKLSGATPDQAKAKIEALEHTVQTVIGARWTPLTNEEVDRLAARLSAMSPKQLSVQYENPFGRDLAQSILDAAKKAGWTNVHLISSGSFLGPGIWVHMGRGTAATIKQAIEASTQLRVGHSMPDADDPGGYFIVIGIKPVPGQS